MFFFLPFLFGLCSCASSSETGDKKLIIVLSATGAVVAVIIIISVICCMKSRRIGCFSNNNIQANEEIRVEKINDIQQDKTLSTNLIPPLFFTQGVKDPLQQDDLMENIKPQ